MDLTHKPLLFYHIETAVSILFGNFYFLYPVTIVYDKLSVDVATVLTANIPLYCMVQLFLPAVLLFFPIVKTSDIVYLLLYTTSEVYINSGIELGIC